MKEMGMRPRVTEFGAVGGGGERARAEENANAQARAKRTAAFRAERNLHGNRREGWIGVFMARHARG